MPEAETFVPLDAAWLEQTITRGNVRLDALNAEFRRQKDDGVKESIRRAMDEVFVQHVSMGNTQEALRLYSRGIREYCTLPNYLITMLLNWITVSVYAEQWPKLGILIPQAERAVAEALERDNATSGGGASGSGGIASMQQRTIAVGVPNSAQKTNKSLKELIATSSAKIAAVAGLAHMKGQHYKEAANKFIQV